jgi:ABC-type Fe3+ transport system permease subunit
VLAGAIMLIGIITIMIDARLMREASRFVTVGSKGSMDRLSPLGVLRMPATALRRLMFALSVGLPLLTLALSTVMRAGPIRLDNFTLDYWIGTNLHGRAAHRHPAQPRPLARRLEQPAHRRRRLDHLRHPRPADGYVVVRTPCGRCRPSCGR